MRNPPGSMVVLAGTIGLLLAACESSTTVSLAPVIGQPFPEKPTAEAIATDTAPATTGSILQHGLLGNVPPKDSDTKLGKEHYRERNFGLAEKHFRLAAESNPNNAEAWLGLAASYDQLRRFELADRAYGEVIKLEGRKPEILNNRGYSYMLRGDYKRARTDFLAARKMDPSNATIENNLKTLARRGRASTE